MNTNKRVQERPVTGNTNNNLEENKRQKTTNNNNNKLNANREDLREDNQMEKTRLKVMLEQRMKQRESIVSAKLAQLRIEGYTIDIENQDMPTPKETKEKVDVSSYSRTNSRPGSKFVEKNVYTSYLKSTFVVYSNGNREESRTIVTYHSMKSDKELSMNFVMNSLSYQLEMLNTEKFLERFIMIVNNLKKLAYEQENDHLDETPFQEVNEDENPDIVEEREFLPAHNEN